MRHSKHKVHPHIYTLQVFVAVAAGEADTRPAFRGDPLVAVNPSQPSLCWLPSRLCCLLHTQELLNTTATVTDSVFDMQPNTAAKLL